MKGGDFAHGVILHIESRKDESVKAQGDNEEPLSLYAESQG